MATFIKEHVSTDVEVLMTDDFGVYPNAMKRAGHDAAKHKTINHSKKIYAQGESAFSLLKARHHEDVAQDQRETSRGIP